MRANVVLDGFRRVRHPLPAGLLYRLRPEEDNDEHGSGAPSSGPDPIEGEDLPYRVELRDQGNQDTVERVLARAFNAPLARAIFQAAQTEHPGRRILLCRGTRVVADSAK